MSAILCVAAAEEVCVGNCVRDAVCELVPLRDAVSVRVSLPETLALTLCVAVRVLIEEGVSSWERVVEDDGDAGWERVCVSVRVREGVPLSERVLVRVTLAVSVGVGVGLQRSFTAVMRRAP